MGKGTDKEEGKERKRDGERVKACRTTTLHKRREGFREGVMFFRPKAQKTWAEKKAVIGQHPHLAS